jgi:hypothetical protein
MMSLRAGGMDFLNGDYKYTVLANKKGTRIPDRKKLRRFTATGAMDAQKKATSPQLICFATFASFAVNQ